MVVQLLSHLSKLLMMLLLFQENLASGQVRIALQKLAHIYTTLSWKVEKC